VVVNEGLESILRSLLRDSVLGTEIRLFTNAVAVTVDTVLADLVEATFPGYVGIPANTLTWPDPAINVDGEAESDGPLMEWEATSDPASPETIRGLYVVVKDNLAVESLYLAYSFPDPTVITVTGDQVAKRLNFFADQY